MANIVKATEIRDAAFWAGVTDVLLSNVIAMRSRFNELRSDNDDIEKQIEKCYEHLSPLETHLRELTQLYLRKAKP